MPLPPITITIDPPHEPGLDFLAAGVPPEARIIRATWRFEHNGDKYGTAIETVALPGTPGLPMTGPDFGRNLATLYRHAADTWAALHDPARQREDGEPPACTDPAHVLVAPLTAAERERLTRHGHDPDAMPVTVARDTLGVLDRVGLQ